ncbi:ornithine carbamoyltransferase [human gut metagenome]|uniref:Ornithine carbamoyltransferase n=1 Tax=human gut metagenome TaxID=408170 RepID=K1TBP5_9ZZZZ
MDLKGRDFLKLLDFTPEEIEYLLDLAADLKDKKKKGIPVDTLRGKNVALIFEKTSTRTRCAFEVAAHDLGMGTTYLDPTGSQIGKKEALPILPEYWQACSRVSNIVASDRILWRNWQNIPRCPYGTD